MSKLTDFLIKDTQDGVMYVTPSGIVFSKETINKFKQCICDAWERIKAAVTEAIKQVWEAVKNIMGHFRGSKGLKKFAKTHNKQVLDEKRKGWHIPKSTIKPSQVWNRKPLYPNIRNRI